MHEQTSPFQKTANILREEFPYYVGRKFTTKQNGICHYCALGYLAKKNGLPDWVLRLGFYEFIYPILRNHGFSNYQLNIDRWCPVGDCRLVTDITRLIGHMNMTHKLSKETIASHIENMEFDKRPVPPTWKLVLDGMMPFLKLVKKPESKYITCDSFSINQ